MKKIFILLLIVNHSYLSIAQINVGNDQTICLNDTAEVIASLQGGSQGAGMDTVICGVHASNYTSNLTRGFYFQAQSSFIITGLMCATENSGPGYNQSVQFVIFGDSLGGIWNSYPPTNTGGTNASFTTLFASIDDTTTNYMLCNIGIDSGQYYGVIGVRHAAGAGASGLGYNSYTAATGANVIIDGNPTQLNRLYYQNGLAGGVAPTGSFLGLVNSQLGRIHMLTGGGVNWYDVSNGQMIGGGDTLSYSPSQSTFVAGVITDSTGQLHTDTMLIDVLNTNVSTTGFSLCNGPVVLTAPSNFATYNWSNGVSTSSVLTVNTPGSYYVNCITSNGLSCQSDPVIIYAGTIPITLSTPDSVFICQGDTVFINGPTGFSQYNWSTGATTSSISTTLTGNYTLNVIDGNGCTGTSNTTTVNISPQSISLSTTGYSLCNGPVTIDAGSGYSSYLWSNNSTNQAIVVNFASSYFVMVTYPTGCTAMSDTITIASASGQFYFTINTSGDDSLCQPNGQVILDAGNFANFNWNTGETTQQIAVSSLGIYYVNVTDSNGCQGVSNPPFEVFNVVNTSAITGTTTPVQFQTETYSVTQSTGSTYYWWINGGVIQSGLGTNTVDISWNIVGSGSIYVLETNTNGCIGDTISLAVTISQSTGVLENSIQHISIYPNPFSENTIINILNNKFNYSLSLYDVRGHKVWQEEDLSQSTYELEKGMLSKGVYFLEIKTEEDKWVKRVVVQ